MASNFRSPEEQRNVSAFGQDEDKVEGGTFNSDWASRVAGMVAVRNSDAEGLEASYFRNKDSLETTGTSPEVSEWKENERLREDAINMQAAQSILSDQSTSEDDKVQQIRGLQDFIDFSDLQPVDLRTSFRRQLAETEPVFSFGDERVQEEALFSFEAREEARDKINEITAENNLSPDSSLWDVLKTSAEKGTLPAEVGGTLLPAQWALKQKDLIEYVFPGSTSAYQNLAVGDARKEFRERVRSMPPQERVDAVRRLIEGVSSQTGILWKWGENNLEEWESIQALVSDIDATDAEINSDRIIDNIFGTLDVVPFVYGVAKRGFNALRGVRNAGKLKELHETLVNRARDRATGVDRTSPAGEMASSSPTRYESLSFEYVRGGVDDVEFEKATGATRAGMAKEGTFPKGQTERINEKPDINDPLARGFILRDRRYRFDPRDVDAVATTRRARFDSLVDSKIVYPLNKMRIVSQNDDVVDYTVAVSSNDKRGFGTPEEAWNAAKSVVEEDTADVQILRKNQRTGDYEPISRQEEQAALNELENWYKGQPHINVKPKGDYIANIKGQHRMNLNDIDAKEDLVIGASGQVAKFLDKDSWLRDWMSKAGSIAFDQASVLEKKMVQKLRPMNALRTKDQEEVLNVLEKGEREILADGTTGKWYRQDELNALFNGDQKKIDAYNAVVDHQRTLYYLTNDRFRQNLVSQGMHELRVGTNSFIGKPMQDVDDAARQVTQAYEPGSGIRSFKPEEIRKLYEDGGRIGILNRVERQFTGPRTGGRANIDSLETRFLVMRSGAEVNQLPHFVLNQRGGYIPRMYNVSHIVGRKVRVRTDDGTIADKVIPYKMASNKAQADRARIRLEREEGEEFQIYGSREIRNDEELGAYADGMSEEFFEDHGMLFTGRRGQEVGHVDADLGRRDLTPIMDALEIARRNASRHAALDPVVASMERYLNKTYGGEFGTKGKITITGPIPNRPEKMDIAREKAYNDMVALRDHIRMLQGFARPASSKASTDLYVAVGDALSDLSMTRVGDLPMARVALEGASEYMYKNAKVDPFRLMKTINFVRLIVMNPIRQALLNSQQMSMYVGLKPQYFGTGQAMKDWTGLTIGVMGKFADENSMLRVMYEGSKGRMAKELGMSLPEYEKFVDDFHQSGFMQAIDSHEYVAYMAVDSRNSAQLGALMKGVRTADNSMKTMIRLARRAGFDAGEFVNRTNAWLVARKEWMDANPGKKMDQAVIDSIHGRANQLALNMNPAGKMAWQEGLTGVAFQFLSHVTKTMQVITPNTRILGLNKVANKAYSNRDKSRIFLTQTALYGTGAFGLNELYRHATEKFDVNVPDWADEWIQEGLIGETVNMAIRLGDAEDERSRIVFSEKYAPLSGAVTGNVPAMLIDSFMTMNLPAELLLGPSMSSVKEFKEIVDFARFVSGKVELPEDESKMAAIFDRAIDFFPVFNNYEKGMIGLAYGQFYSQHADPTVRATKMEALAKAALGVQSAEERDVTNLLRGWQGLYVQKEGGSQEEVQTLARNIFERTKKLAMQFGEGEIDRQELADMLETTAQLYKASLPEHEYVYIFRNYLPARLMEDYDEETRSSELAKAIINGLNKGSLGLDETRRRIQNVAEFEGKADLMKSIDYQIDVLNNLKDNKVGEVQ